MARCSSVPEASSNSRLGTVEPTHSRAHTGIAAQYRRRGCAGIWHTQWTCHRAPGLCLLAAHGSTRVCRSSPGACAGRYFRQDEVVPNRQ
jgi:hypothetical protein